MAINLHYRLVYDFFNNKFLVDCGILDLNISPMIIDGSTHPNKRALYITDLILDAIYVAYRKPVITLTTFCDPTTYDDRNTDHTTIIYKHECDKWKKGYGGMINQNVSNDPCVISIRGFINVV